MGRAPAFWTEENAKLIKDNFVAVSLSNFDQNRKDAVGQFLRDAGMQLPGAGGSQWCVTVSGKNLLGKNAHVQSSTVKKALETWQALPEVERAPGAVKVGELGERDDARAGATPPVGGLILKIHYRALMRDGAGRLRYMVAKDLWHDEEGKKTEESFDRTYPGRITTPQAQPDHMWLTEAEWKSLMPAAPHPGDKLALPSAIANRLIRWHLNPLTVYGETAPLGAKAVRAGEMSLTVEEVVPRLVRLRLDGFAKLGTTPPDAVAQSKIACIDQWGYEPRVLGFLEYDPQKKVFTRFDIVALGDQFGRLGICDSAARVGLQPLGISFELVEKPRPADCVPPGRTPTSRAYFELVR